MPGLDDALSSLTIHDTAGGTKENGANKEEPKPKLSLFAVKSADATPAAEEVTLRGGADAAFDGWGEEHDDEAPAVKRCLADDTWDALMGDEAPAEALGELLGLVASERPAGGLQMDVAFKAHRDEPTADGTEPLLVNIRQFSLRAEMLAPEGLSTDGLTLRVALVYDLGDDIAAYEDLDTAAALVPPQTGEAPLSGEFEAVPVGGAATFRLRCVALSYKHSRRRFRILAQAAAPPAAAGLPPQVCATAVSAAFRSVARLPNEAKPEARAPPAAAACASFSSATSFSPPTSPQHSIGGESDASTAALELAQLREQLQLESADNAANKAAIAAQAEMLDVLSRQQAQILAELQRLRPGSETAPAVVPGLGW